MRQRPRGQGGDGAFARVAGTFAVELDTTQHLDEFHLSVVSPTVPTRVAGRSDPDRCWDVDNVANVADSATRLNADPGSYEVVKQSWISAPRLWWAVRATAQQLRQGDDTSPAYTACFAWSE